MIKGREHLAKFNRDVQVYETRLNRLRLGFNEYVPHIKEKYLKEIMDDLSLESFSAYPEVNTAYNLVANYVNMSTENILLGHGSDGVHFTILSAFCNPGDTICSIIPTFGMYEVYAAMLNCKFITVSYDKQRQIKKEELLNLAKQSPKAIIIANPNGVIGSRIPTDHILELVKEAEKNNTLVIIDEAYAEFSKETIINYVNKFSNLIVVRSFSKSMGMAGLRIGYAILNKELKELAYKMKPVVELNSVAVSAVKVLCRNKSVLEELIECISVSKEFTTRNLKKMGYVVLDTETNFILVNFGNSENAVVNQFAQKHIEIKKLPIPFEGFYRVTVGTLDVMGRFTNELKDISSNEK